MKPVVLGRSASAASADPPLLPPSSRSTLMRGSSTGADQDATRTYKSKFKRALRRVDVPPALQQGIPVMRVYANGEKPKKQYLTLSRDKFTLYITSKPMDPRHFQEDKKARGGAWFSLRRTSSIESAKGGGAGLHDTAEGSRKRANKEVRTIDIGAIHRIQRGAHNANLKTTTTSAATVQNLSRRTRSDLRKGRPDSFSRVSPVSSPNSSTHHHSDSIGGSSVPVHNQAELNNIYNPFDITNQGNNNVPFDFKNPNFVPDTKPSTARFSWSSIKSNSSATTAMTTTALDPGMCFSIIFRGDWTLDLMMTDFDIMTTKTSSTRGSLSSKNSTDDNSLSSASRITRDVILDALDSLIRAYQSAKRQVANDVLLLRYVWSEADQDKSNTIKPNELGGVFDRINYQMKKSELNSMYEQFCKVIGLKSKDRKHGLTFEQTCTLLHKVKRDSWMVKPVNQYWNTLFGEFMNNGKPRMTVSNKTFLEKFLHQKQGEKTATLADVNCLFRKLNEIELPHIAGEGLAKDPTRIDKNRFEVYLLGEDNDAFDPKREAYDERIMHRPISEYWINSSHNTYLTGDQLTSSSSIDMYSNALYRGCKCLELDVWDGGYSSDGEPVPVVWHGHTMTSKILYKDIIKAIKLYVNFHPDTFPLILSYENHCSIPFQEVMAAQLNEILGDSLYTPKEDSLQGRLPSPSDLRGMVVIKGRRPANLDIDDTEDGNNSDDGAPSTIWVGSDFGTSSLASSLQQNQQQKIVLQKVCPALARLTLFHGTKLKSWDDSLLNPTHHMHSFSESKIRSLCRKTDRQKWVIYNQSHMSRSYPAGSRVDSSNYSPILPWALGTQLVALNFQTVDPPLLLNDGRFRENGGCGYVLKSTKLIDLQEPPSEYNKESRVPVQLSVSVLSGSCLPKPNDARNGDCINPYVRVSVYDVRNGDKETTVSYSTPVVANGFFPIWNTDCFKFRIENYETAMLQMTVFDRRSTISTGTTGGDELIGSSSIPVYCLRKGLRSVKIFDTSNTRSGAYDFASLLIDVKKERARSVSAPTMQERRSSTSSAQASTLIEI